MTHRFYKVNFKYIANRYEEWQAGHCISQGSISTVIKGEVCGNEIHFELSDIGNIRILKSFDFEIYDEGSCILPDRIQYTHGTSDFNPIVPIVCNIFYSGNTMQYVRFAMINPDRIVEFYGTLIEIGQPSIGKRTAQPDKSTTSAESILKELCGYGMLKADVVMERAVKLYNDNVDVANIIQAKLIAESLKLFVKAYQLEEESEEIASPLKPKILMFIALCNYKIDNINQAYCVAKQGHDAIDEAIENSIFTGIPRSMYGADMLDSIINSIETNHFDKVKDKDNYYDVDPEDINTTRLDKKISMTVSNSSKPSKQQIKNMIDTISHVQSEFSKVAEQVGDGLRGFQIHQTLETFKFPLYFAWQGYKYGWHTGFCEEGDSLFPLMIFEAEIKKNTQDLITLLKTQSPFAQIENNSAITNSLISIYKAFINDMDNGKIKL